MAKNLIGINLKGLTSVQRGQMSKHKINHTKRHLAKMATLMRQGKTFKQSHTIAMRTVGK